VIPALLRKFQFGFEFRGPEFAAVPPVAFARAVHRIGAVRDFAPLVIGLRVRQRRDAGHVRRVADIADISTGGFSVMGYCAGVVI